MALSPAGLRGPLVGKTRQGKATNDGDIIFKQLSVLPPNVLPRRMYELTKCYIAKIICFKFYFNFAFKRKVNRVEKPQLAKLFPQQPTYFVYL